MKALFNEVVYAPLYNLLVGLLHVVPFADVGLAVVGLTIIVKTILFPLQRRLTQHQEKMKKMQPHLDALKEKGLSREDHGRAMMDLHKEHGANPFAPFGIILIQLPILIGLYLVFLKGFSFPIDQVSAAAHALGYVPGSVIPHDALYSFVSVPDTIRIKFLGLLDLTQKSLLLALLAGVTQFFQARLMTPPPQPSSETVRSFEKDMAKSMQAQALYVLPVIITFIAWRLNGAIALYWVVGNLFGVLSELLRRRFSRAV